jgi:hypothetical protein
MSVANETRNSVSLEEVKTFRAPIDPLARRSVICAWLFFLTPIAPVLAVVFGLLAIGKSRGRDERSASRATIATFVGLTALIGWIFASYAALQIYQQIQGIKSFSNQRVLGFYLLNYAEAHNQQLPDSWAELVADSDNPNLVAGTVPQDVAKFLVSPASGNKPATGPTTQAVLKDLASGEHISYLYLGQGLNF